VAASSRAQSAANLPEPHPDLLELRGVGMRVDVWAQTQIWHFLKDPEDAYRTVLSKDPKDYPTDAANVQDTCVGDKHGHWGQRRQRCVTI
jgi:hypothetical protein